MPDSLTLAIPYYSGKNFLSRAIESVRRQRNQDWQLLVCDDSPSDDGICRLVADLQDGRIRYVRNPKTLGLAGNWNQCLDLAQTDLVTILHADDELLPNYCDEMLAAADQFPAAAGCFCRATIIDDRGRAAFSLPDTAKRWIAPRGVGPLRLAGPAAIASLLRGNYIICPTMCYRRQRLGARRFDDRWQFVVDLDFFVRLLAEGEELIGVPATAYAYRRHPDSATAQHTRTLHRFDEERAFYDQLAATGRERGWDEVVRVADQKRIVRLNLGWCILKDLAALRLADAGRKWSLCRGLTHAADAPQAP